MMATSGNSKPTVYSLAIIGAGSAGLTAADFACRLGGRVVLIEENQIGGDCTWSGCVPSKALVAAAKAAHTCRTAAVFGVKATVSDGGARSSDPDATTLNVKCDMQRVHDHVKAKVAQIAATETQEVLEAKGINVLMGRARFISRHDLIVTAQDGSMHEIHAERIVVATGAKPRVPSFVKLPRHELLTYENVFDLTQLPHHLVVIGGGPIGCELAQCFRRFGSNVTVVSHRLLGTHDKDAQAALGQVFETEGIQHIAAHVQSVNKVHDQTYSVLTSTNIELECDKVLVAVGRIPNTHGLGLTDCGISLDKDGGVIVSDTLHTDSKHVFGAGDCTSSPQFTHLAGYQGFMAVRNALLPFAEAARKPVIPRCIFTDPEVASIGLSEDEFIAQHGSKGDVMVWKADKLYNNCIQTLSKVDSKSANCTRAMVFFSMTVHIMK
eukprot:m.149365 g.149365  ORF g.149365 m.149365 type:complete len:438 (+) comp14206_c0_seq4:73-1386(+)